MLLPCGGGRESIVKSRELGNVPLGGKLELITGAID